MRFRTKVAILIVAVLLTFVSFNMIASSAVDIMKIGKLAGNEIIANVLIKAKAADHHSNLMKGQT
jgi:predicted exporter